MPLDVYKGIEGSFLEYPESGTPALYREYREDEIPEVDRREVLRYAGIPLHVLRNKENRKKDADACGEKSDKTGGQLSKSGEQLNNSCEKPADTGEQLSDSGINSSLSEPDGLLDSGLLKLLERSVSITCGAMSYRVSYIYAPIRWEPAEDEAFPILPFEQYSRALKRNLEGCTGVVIFAATAGAGIDRLIRRYEKSEPSCGAFLQAIGAERVEALCDKFNDEVNEAARSYGFETRPRFSPGFADFYLAVQPEILSLVNAQRRLGITLDSSLLMSPSKSVTGIIGLRR
ncbi:MAG: hypothetical protein IJ123_06645 [Blautia sp.]|nr:hypothetical protein [Blautia sp.]